MVDAVNAGRRGVTPPQQIPPNGAAKAVVELQQLKIASISGDFLVCNPYNGTEADDTQEIIVARPWLLRRSMTSRNSITFSYSSDQARTATSGATTESQVIVPSYIVGDIINAARNVAGGTGVTFGTNTTVEWLDANESARAWAKAAS